MKLYSAIAKVLLACIALSVSITIQAQNSSQKAKVNERVQLLFDAMRANDSSMVEGLFTADATLSTVMVDEYCNANKKTSPASGFVTAIGTPRDQIFDEKIWSYDVKIDGHLASVWTEYTFYLGEQMSHCGVNVFELIKGAQGWQISAVTDTRRKKTCTEDKIDPINKLMDQWHHAAAVADEDFFFGSMTDDGIYIGTDSTERWTRDEMFALLGKYFERESTWAFTSSERNITIDDDGETAWFDELLNTWMGVCRSSGVLKMIDGKWKIAHYHLSIAVPNDKVDQYLEIIGMPPKN